MGNESPPANSPQPNFSITTGTFHRSERKIFVETNSEILVPILALRPPSFMPQGINLLFETNLKLWLAGIALGVALLFVARARNDRFILRGGQTLLAFVLLWIIAAFAFDTPAERLHRV